MRIAEFLRASFVGALLFTPAMADDVEKVHEEAVRVLREKLGQANDNLPSPGGANAGAYKAPVMQVDPRAAKERAERDARIRAEAQQRIAEREKLQAERRVQFEQFVKERERLRQQQHQYDLNAARKTGQIRPDDYNPVHAQALQALHQAEAQPASTSTVAAAPTTQPSTAATSSANEDVTQRALQIVRENNQTSSSTPRVSEREVAPKLLAAAAEAAKAPGPSAAQSEVNDVHAKALEVLHQQLQNQSAPTNATAVKSTPSKPSSNTAQPSPDLQRRLKQMQLELEQEEQEKAKARGNAKPANVTIAPAPAVAPTPATTTDAYLKDLEQRAQGMVSQSSAPAAAPSATTAAPRGGVSAPSGLDATTREIIRRQDQEISKSVAAPAKPSNAGARAATPIPQGMTPEQEAAALAALRAQGQASSAPQANVRSTPAAAPASNVSAPASRAPSAAPKAPAVTQRTETDTANVQYSKELEERARQILLERAQNQQAATPQPAAAPVATAVQSPAPAPVQPTAPTIAATPAPAAPVNAAAAPAVSAVPTPAQDVHSQAQQTLEQIRTGSAPKTKMERLKEITDLYRADKMTPAEYHQKRAQILAEPR